MRIEITGINTAEFLQVFQSNEFPALGTVAHIQEGLKIVNLTSSTPNLIDTGVFTFLLDSVVELTNTVLTGLLVCYLYDALKGKKDVEITSIELSTKIKIEVQKIDDE
ncbi:MAG: hypothetical protein FWD05_09260 [Oscillospiraceae bacterium]|nr:hypothetical protein [Oscillospiraceae bacterium]